MSAERPRMSLYRNVAWEMAQTNAAVRLLQAYHQAGIPVIILKGQALRGRVYVDVGARPMNDIDLLVRRSDWHRALAVLQELGFVFDESAGDWTADFAFDYMGEIPYRQEWLVVDLHWHLIVMAWYRRTTALDLAGLWERAVSGEVEGAPVLYLAPEDELAHLCYHTAVHHGLAHTRGYRDILRLIRALGKDLDWDVLAQRARTWRVSAAVWSTLCAAQQLSPEDVPEDALSALKVAPWRQRVLQLFVKRALSKGKPAFFSHTMRFLNILFIDRLRDVPLTLVRGLFPGRRWLQARYNLSPRAARWRQLVYPVEVAWHGLRALFLGGKT